MTKPIYANKEHQVIIEGYIMMMQEFIRDVSNEVRWKNYIEIFEIVIKYHNNSYCGGTRTHSYWDWLMILPINLSVMTNGFLAGIETKRNKILVNSYKVLLNELLHDVVEKIEKIEPIHE
jgi:hypothetical protein